MTLAKAEHTKNAELVRRVKSAEAAAGIRTGVRFSASGEHRVSVTFYPSVRFWISDVVDGGEVNERLLTADEYAKTEGLKL